MRAIGCIENHSYSYISTPLVLCPAYVYPPLPTPFLPRKKWSSEQNLNYTSLKHNYSETAVTVHPQSCVPVYPPPSPQKEMVW